MGSTETLDAAVSFDGTWAKRGCTSLTGVVFVISVDTGEVLDYHVLPKLARNVPAKRPSVKGMMTHLKNGEGST